MRNPKTIALLTTILFFGSVFWLTNTHRVNSSLEASLQKEKLRSEALLSEKLLLEKEMQRMKDQLFSLKTDNLELDNFLKTATAKFQAQEADYNRMKKENLSLNQIKKQRQDLIALQSQLENELQALRSSFDDLRQKNENLVSTIALLEDKNRVLKDDLNRALFASADKIQIQAVKRNPDRMTLKAARTKKLVARFDVPANLVNLSYRMLDSKGNMLTQKDGTIASTSTPSDDTFIASADPDAPPVKVQNIEVIYIPKQKLKSGIYTVEVLNDNLHVSSLKIKLK